MHDSHNQQQYVFPYSIHRLALLMVKVCVLCEVRSESLWYIWALKSLMTLSIRQIFTVSNDRIVGPCERTV